MKNFTKREISYEKKKHAYDNERVPSFGPKNTALTLFTHSNKFNNN